jgi:nitroreductase
MELKDVISKRRSIRIFKDDIVDEEVLFEGLKYGVLAPSAHNRQPWKFKIVSTDQKNEIADALDNKTKDIPGHTGPHTANIIRNVPHLIMVFIDNDIKENRDMDVISIGACIQNIILSYTDLGLGTLWIGNTNHIVEEIKEILGVPYETVSCIGVGVADQEPKPRPRKDFKDVII